MNELEQLRAELDQTRAELAQERGDKQDLRRRLTAHLCQTHGLEAKYERTFDGVPNHLLAANIEEVGMAFNSASKKQATTPEPEQATIEKPKPVYQGSYFKPKTGGKYHRPGSK